MNLLANLVNPVDAFNKLTILLIRKSNLVCMIKTKQVLFHITMF